MKVLTSVVKNFLGLKTSPAFCTYIVTWRCNAKCQMCEIWQKESSPEKELSLEEIKKTFSQLKLDGIRITGGEPFLRTDFPDIINVIQKLSHPSVLHITSNGLLTQKIVNDLVKIENLSNVHLKISIDAFGKTHDQIRQTPGAFKSAMSTIEELANLRKKRKFYLGVNQTIINSQGIEDYYKLKQILERHNIKIHQVLAYNQTALYAKKDNLNLMNINGPANNYNLFFDFNSKEKKKIIELFEKEANEIKDFKEKIVKKYYLLGMRNRLLLNQQKPNPKCVALKNHLRILPNGDVPICLFNSTIIGNLKNQSLKKLWNGKEIKKYRALIKKCPGCWAGCEIIPSAIYTGDIIRGLF